MGVCIDLVGFAMGSPAGVGNADGAGEVLALATFLEGGHFSFCLIDV